MNPNLINQVSPSGRFKRHPLSASLPTMTEIELATLVRSIQRAGQLEDVIMLEDQVLDGWNRVLACELAGVEPRLRLLGEGERAINSVIGRNFDRRSPTDSVKSIAIVDMYYEINKLDEDSHAPVLRAGGNVAPLHEIDWTKASIWPQSRKQLAELAGVSETLIKQALRLRRNGVPAIAESVRNGTLPLNEATQLLWQPRRHQAGCLAELVEQRAKEKVRRRSEQKEAAVLKKAGLLLGDKSMSTAERIRVSTTLPGENSSQEVDARTHVHAILDDRQDFLDATQAVDRCVDLLTGNPDGINDDGGIDRLTASCSKLLGLVAHRMKSMELGTSFGGGGIEENAASCSRLFVRSSAAPL